MSAALQAIKTVVRRLESQQRGRGGDGTVLVVRARECGGGGGDTVLVAVGTGDDDGEGEAEAVRVDGAVRAAVSDLLLCMAPASERVLELWWGHSRTRYAPAAGATETNKLAAFFGCDLAGISAGTRSSEDHTTWCYCGLSQPAEDPVRCARVQVLLWWQRFPVARCSALHVAAVACVRDCVFKCLGWQLYDDDRAGPAAFTSGTLRACLTDRRTS
eukprot:TRINITY_DN3577_c0_g1_i1.p1 TRINITY_DN3577_c0_g1~~TRINITY_DN3577_c0_g1_i1.p1  ORF type:complete len:216 (-),score=61.64 TRINITY_DN3577_c0_g1_i1:476-1123(-)